MNVTEQLEAMIDATSLLHVMTGLELVCAEKAEHLRHTWQDASTARAWGRASEACGKIARNEAQAVS